MIGLLLVLVATPVRAQECVPAADLHVDVVTEVHYHGRSPDLARPGSAVTAEALRAGCVELLVLSVHLPSGLAPRRPEPGELDAVLATAAEVAASAGIDVVFSLEGADAIAGEPERVAALVRRGVLLFGLTHAFHNALADSATDPHPGRGGLTAAGERFVRAVYRAGGLVDVSHLSDGAFEDVARLARAHRRPLVATHSNARAIMGSPRNLTDAQLRTIARSGGVAGVDFHAPHLAAGDAGVDDVVRHLLHMVEVMGAAHVAIGSDLDGAIRPAEGFESHAALPSLAAALRRAGLAEPDVRALLGGNARRLLRR